MNKKILLVDDDRLILEMLTFGLQRMNMEIRTAVNGVDALQTAWEFQPDIIIMDIMMPMIDGMEAAAVLKNHPRTSKIPIIFISGSGNVPPPEITANLAEAYIRKPFQLEDLISRINAVLQEKDSLDREIREERDFFGKLSLIGLPDLIQLFEHGKNSGRLTLSNEGKMGLIYFQDGKVLDAIVGQRRGKAAIYHLLPWTKGDFSFHGEAISIPPAIYASGTELVLEGMRRLDERQRILSQLPLARTTLVVRPQVMEKLSSKKLSSDLKSFLEIFDGKRTLGEIVEQMGEDEVETMERILRLYSSGFLQEHPMEDREDS